VPAVEALMDGHQVMTAADAAAWGEIFVTATGNLNVFREEHFRVMQDGAVLSNSGHFDAELELSALERLAEGHVREARENVREYDLGEKKLYLLAEGRLVNLGAAEGHPAAVMDMSFAGQALAAEYVAANHAALGNEVHVLPQELDEQIARLKLESRDIFIDDMTPEQLEYYNSWKQGT
jgi:adenosylhomocysteinase